MGTDQLPVVFQLSHGREFLVRGDSLSVFTSDWMVTRSITHSSLHTCASVDAVAFVSRLHVQVKFEGVTVGRDGLCVVCPSKPHVFTPVFIGDSNPPRQVRVYLNMNKQRGALFHTRYVHISTSLSSRCTDFTMVVRCSSVTQWTCPCCLGYRGTILTTHFYAVSIQKGKFFPVRQ